jgi:alpha-beta hydrolase superfamily lysophospholipase
MERFWRTLPGTLLLVLILAIVTAAGAMVIQVHRATHPPRERDETGDLGAILSHVEEVRFRSADGIDLAGWLVRGAPGGAPVVLCHDLGAGKGSLVNLAIALQNAGFTALAFDFRGHGKSGGLGSTLGIHERRDVVGALDFLATLKDVDTRRIGLYGVGLGAQAAVLAAADRPAAKVLVLDGLYPDPAYPLVRKVYAGWGFGARYLGILPRLTFYLLVRVPSREESAADVLPHLLSRDLLFVAPAGDTALAAEMQRLYASVPEQRDVDANLIVLPATRSSHLYGEELDRYNRRITEFFQKRLARP